MRLGFDPPRRGGRDVRRNFSRKPRNCQRSPLGFPRGTLERFRPLEATSGADVSISPRIPRPIFPARGGGKRKTRSSAGIPGRRDARWYLTIVETPVVPGSLRSDEFPAPKRQLLAMIRAQCAEGASVRRRNLINPTPFQEPQDTTQISNQQIGRTKFLRPVSGGPTSPRAGGTAPPRRRWHACPGSRQARPITRTSGDRQGGWGPSSDPGPRLQESRVGCVESSMTHPLPGCVVDLVGGLAPGVWCVFEDSTHPTGWCPAPSGP
jgi:hypothetical protein